MLISVIINKHKCKILLIDSLFVCFVFCSMNPLGVCSLVLAALLALSFGEPSSPWHLNRQIGGYAGGGYAGGGFGGGGDLTRDMGELEQTYRLLKMVENLSPVLDTGNLEKYESL